MIKIKFLDEDQRYDIGFNFIMNKLEVITSYGISEKRNMKIYKKNEKELLINELENVEKIIQSINKHKEIYSDIEKIMHKFKDIKNSVKRCKNLNILDEIEIYEIKIFSILIEELISKIEDLNLHVSYIHFNSQKKIINLLDPENQNIPTFYIYDSYSEELKNLRSEKRLLENKIYKEDNEEQISILKEKRLNIVILEEKEELEIKKYISSEINKYIDTMEQNIKSLGKLDLLIAKGNLAINYNGVKPRICDDYEITLMNAFNPNINYILSKKSKEFVPISIYLNKGITLITGANMGGKSVTLKTIVLNLLLSQMGLFVFCKDAVIPILDFIYFISDDMQSITKGLSTFGAEIVKLKEVIECIKRGNGFVALDEFARGTNPKEGYILTKSLSKYLKRFDTISIMATHYDNVIDDDIDHYQVIGLKNVNFDSLKYKINLNKKHSIEIIQEYMDYRIEKVNKEDKVPKDALNISMLLGLEEEIIELAKLEYTKGEDYGE